MILVRELSDSNNNHKKTEDPLKGHSAFDNSTWLPSGRTYTYTKILSTTLRLCNPLLLDEQNNELDLSTPYKYGYQYKTEHRQSDTVHLQQK
mgnify:CR=1 FL=1